ncbi:MAG: helix-turn-helix domain-containing protein [Deltaproteobacteria bacterium]|nr:helix-turn-helix domain-containing protein [Deltaproteobacteria bacterium]
MTGGKFNLILACDDVKRRNMLHCVLRHEYQVYMPSCAADILNYTFASNVVALISECFQKNDGLQVLGNIKRAKPYIPVIFTALKGSENLCLNAFRLGAKDYFSEPVDFKELVKCIENVISLSLRNQRFRTMQELHCYDEYQERCGDRRKGDDRRKDAHRKNAPDRRETIDRRHALVKKTLLFIEENYSKDLNLGILSKVAGMSKSHFSRQFKEITGVTYARYLCMARIREAKRLLKNAPFSVSEICYAVGYNDLTHFERSFKNMEGLTPSQFRRK